MKRTSGRAARAGAPAPSRLPRPAVARAAAPMGRHWLVEFHGTQRLDETAHIRAALRAAVAACGATLLRLQLHHFGPGHGVTGVALLAESHLSIHTWPEFGYAAIDIFLCGPADPQAALDALVERLRPRRRRVRRFERLSG